MKSGLALRYAPAAIMINNCVTRNIATASYTTVLAATTKACSAIRISNSSARDIRLAYNIPGQGTRDWFLVGKGEVSEILPTNIPAGTALLARAYVGIANSGIFSVEFYA